jgi:hypothetical protein
MEGTTIFAPISNVCNASSKPTDICYNNSQGYDCPEGYGCGLATTSFTQFDFYCEPGFWCKARTLPEETRNLLCPAGYYCKNATTTSGGSGRKSFSCRLNYYCPEGTAAIDKQINGRQALVLYNVMADLQVIMEPDLERNSMCRRCPEDTPPASFDYSVCLPCGMVLDPAVAVWQGQEIGRRLSRPMLVVDPDGNPFPDAVDGEDASGIGTWPWHKTLSGDISGSEPTFVTPPPRLLQSDEEEEPDPVDYCAPDVRMGTNFPLPRWEPGQPCYSTVREARGTLECPRGTKSKVGSKALNDCI